MDDLARHGRHLIHSVACARSPEAIARAASRLVLEVAGPLPLPAWVRLVDRQGGRQCRAGHAVVDLARVALLARDLLRVLRVHRSLGARGVQRCQGVPTLRQGGGREALCAEALLDGVGQVVDPHHDSLVAEAVPAHQAEILRGGGRCVDGRPVGPQRLVAGEALAPVVPCGRVDGQELSVRLREELRLQLPQLAGRPVLARPEIAMGAPEVSVENRGHV
mmetsp:Transcript_29774/g.80528  ORF Transcript_29774/g.80528 Transcript_29774/m.80528 type:complete len:220 (+) Transcript_29774:1002-1661(+)